MDWGVQVLSAGVATLDSLKQNVPVIVVFEEGMNR